MGVAQAVRVMRLVVVTNEFFRFGVERVQPVGRADPQHAQGIAVKSVEAVIRKAEAIGGVVPVVREFAGFAIEFIESSSTRAEPQLALLIFRNCYHIVVRKAVRVAGIVPVAFEAVAVVTVQAVCRAQPYESFAVLKNCIDRALRQALLDRNMLELEFACLRRQRRCSSGAQDDSETEAEFLQS